MQNFETVIGLEIHLQFNTQTKIFCGCSNVFGAEPNSKTCPVCLGLPGTLPVLNKEALYSAIKVALALNCKINPYIKFDRKNYYYPDLPKGYQISQYDLPIASDGFVMVPTGDDIKKINVKRAHIEEDAGKLIHDTESHCSLVDYNRTGTPLLEIVTEPDIRSPQEAYDYLRTIKLIFQYLEVSDCDMEKGSLRCDANISIRKKGEAELGTKTELKNMNSFKAVKTALEFEVNRHRQTVDAGQSIVQETRLWNEAKGQTIVMRSKEEAHDYRYFPEPDLVPFIVDEHEIDTVRKSLPEMPQEKQIRLTKEHKLSEYDANIIVQNQELAIFFEKCVKLYKGDTKKVSNWIIGPLLQELNTRRKTVDEISLGPAEFISLITKVDDGSLSNLAAKDVLRFTLDTNKNIEDIINEKGLTQVSDEGELDKIVDQIITENEKVVTQIKEGKDSAMGFLVGQAMKKTQGKANPKKVGEIIRRRLQDA